MAALQVAPLTFFLLIGLLIAFLFLRLGFRLGFLLLLKNTNPHISAILPVPPVSQAGFSSCGCARVQPVPRVLPHGGRWEAGARV